MDNLNPDVVGMIAAVLTTVCFIPQVLRIIKTKDTSAISLPMYILFCLGVFCWMIYGIMLSRTPIIIANIVTLGLGLIILFFKLREKR